MRINAVGIDAAFANMGFAKVHIDVSPGQLARIVCDDLILVSTTVIEDRKVVRKSSTELRRAQELCEALAKQCAGASFAFVEVPSGSQSASAARALGIAVGVLASCPIPIIEVSPMEVKREVQQHTGGRTAPSKAEIIKWAMVMWPNAPWVLHTHESKGRTATKGANKGKIVGTFRKGDAQACNEHLADALAAVAAGLKTQEFTRLVALGMSAQTLRRRVVLNTP